MDVIHDEVKWSLQGSDYHISNIISDSFKHPDSSGELLGEEVLKFVDDIVLGFFIHSNFVE
jgi:hypothetical protein